MAKELGTKDHALKAYMGMRYCEPLIEQTLTQILADGIKEVIALPMTPFQSSASTGAYIEEVNRVNEKFGSSLKVSFVKPWHLHPLFVGAVREKIDEGLDEFSSEERGRVHLIFTAHSLPKTMLVNDPYVTQIEESVRAIVQTLQGHPWHMAFQSKGAGPVEWMGPDVESVLEELAKQNICEVLVIPIGFVSDHVEILYDIDIAYRKKAESLGIVFKRSPSLNTSGTFLKALTAVIEEHLRSAK